MIKVIAGERRGMGGRSGEKLLGEKLESDGREIHVRIGGSVQKWPEFIAERRTDQGRKRLGRMIVCTANTCR